MASMKLTAVIKEEGQGKRTRTKYISEFSATSIRCVGINGACRAIIELLAQLGLNPRELARGFVAEFEREFDIELEIKKK